MTANTPVIVDVLRSAVGRAHKGSLVDVRPDDLAGYILRRIFERHPEIETATVEDAPCGCGFPWGEQGYNVGRNIALLGGLPHSVPAQTITRLCASSLEALRTAAHAVSVDEGEVFAVTGVESVSRVGRGIELSELNPRLDPNAPGDKVGEVFTPMGVTAENVADDFGITREEMDAFAQRSQERAIAARERGVTAREIEPFTLPDGHMFDTDDSPRASSSLEKLAELQPVFREGGRVTAGNSCPLNDGAAAAIVTSEQRAADLGIRPRARIIASAVSGVDPARMGIGPIEAIRKVLDRAGMTIDDVDVFEINEAFAAQVIPVCREVGIDPFDDRVNPHGGAIAIGHPFGMTGLRIMASLLNALETRDGTIGLETMCVGGGQGQAMIVERLQ